MMEPGRNVDTAAAPVERAKKFWEILKAAIDVVDDDVDEKIKARARRFMLHVAWHEGKKLVARVQDGNGPARSFFQLEAHRAKDGIAYARQKGWLNKLVPLANGPVTADGLAAEGDKLPMYDPAKPNESAKFPNGNLIESQLRTADAFGVGLARVCLRKLPEALPEGNAAEADYWYKYWKVSGGDPEKLKKTFIAECNEVDGLLTKDA